MNRHGNDLAVTHEIRYSTGGAVTGEPSLRAVVGDITQSNADAIVNAANNELWMGSGVAGAIKRAGGEEIEQEAIALGPIQVGEAVATSAGRLPNRAVLHAAAMGFADGQMIPPSAESIRQATISALQLAEELQLASIAFPALGTGVGGFDLAKTAEIMVEAVTSFLSQPSAHLSIVQFVLTNENARQTFAEAIEQGGFVA